MFDKSCFITDTAVWPEVKIKKLNFFIFSFRSLKTQNYLVKIGLFCSDCSFCDHFNRKLTEAVVLYSKP